MKVRVRVIGEFKLSEFEFSGSNVLVLPVPPAIRALWFPAGFPIKSSSSAEATTLFSSAAHLAKTMAFASCGDFIGAERRAKTEGRFSWLILSIATSRSLSDFAPSAALATKYRLSKRMFTLYRRMVTRVTSLMALYYFLHLKRAGLIEDWRYFHV